MKLLVTGNIGYITTEFIEEAFPECQILLLGETEQKSNRNKSLSVYPMPKTEEEFKDIFKTYEFEGVIYFSNYLTFHGTMEGEIETLHKLLHYYKGNLNSRLLYITGPDSLYEDTTGKTLMVRPLGRRVLQAIRRAASDRCQDSACAVSLFRYL